MGTHKHYGQLEAIAAPRARASITGTPPSISNGTITTVSLNAEDYDTNGLHSTTTNPSRITLDRAGAWLVVGSLGFLGNAAGRRIGIILKNGAEVARNLTFPTTAAISLVTTTAVVSANAADYVELQAYQDSGTALSLVPEYVQLTAIYLGA